MMKTIRSRVFGSVVQGTVPWACHVLPGQVDYSIEDKVVAVKYSSKVWSTKFGSDRCEYVSHI